MDYGKFDVVLYYSLKFGDWREGQIVDVIPDPRKETKYKIRTNSDKPLWQHIERTHSEVKIIRKCIRIR